MNQQRFSTYSLADTDLAFQHPSVGAMIVTGETSGGGRVVVGHSGDLSSHTQTANGYVVVNKLHFHNGTLAVEVAQNSAADMFFRKYANYIENSPTREVALATFTLRDNVSGIQIVGTGVSLQKRPDRQYDQQAGNLTYTFLVADMTEN